MWNAYFDKCLSWSEDCKLGIGWYKHITKKNSKTKSGGDYYGFTVHMFLFKWMVIFTFVTNHDEYVNAITRNGRWTFEPKRLIPLKVPKGGSAWGTRIEKSK